MEALTLDGSGFRYARFDGPLGPIVVIHGERGLRAVRFGARVPAGLRPGSLPAFGQALAGYLRGRDLVWGGRLDVRGTPFQEEVWTVLRAVPRGTVTTYGDIARAVGRPGAGRAVGNACGANPLPIVIPCHRVLPADGRLGGYASGVGRKRRLLGIEGIRPPP